VISSGLFLDRATASVAGYPKYDLTLLLPFIAADTSMDLLLDTLKLSELD